MVLPIAALSECVFFFCTFAFSSHFVWFIIVLPLLLRCTKHTHRKKKQWCNPARTNAMVRETNATMLAEGVHVFLSFFGLCVTTPHHPSSSTAFNGCRIFYAFYPSQLAPSHTLSYPVGLDSTSAQTVISTRPVQCCELQLLYSVSRTPCRWGHYFCTLQNGQTKENGRFCMR